MPRATDATFSKVRAIIAESQGMDPGKITMATDVCGDLGVAGLDGEDLLKELDRAFDIDWSGLHFSVHFGEEVCGLPMPWQLEKSYLTYKSQAFRVSDIVHAAQSGKWPDTPLIRQTGAGRGLLFFGSYLQMALLAFIAAAALFGSATIYLR